MINIWGVIVFSYRYATVERRKGNKEERKNKRKSKDEVKSEFFRSLVVGEVYKNDNLGKRADKIMNYQEAVDGKKNIWWSLGSILNAAQSQGYIFKKIKEFGRFLEMVREIELSKSIIYFRLKL